jgi:hypothetical protein
VIALSGPIYEPLVHYGPVNNPDLEDAASHVVTNASLSMPQQYRYSTKSFEVRVQKPLQSGSLMLGLLVLALWLGKGEGGD